jgi:hypothetical protein
MLIPVTRSIVVAGGVEPRFERADPVAVTWHRLVTSPPFDAWPAQGSARYRIVRYVREVHRTERAAPFPCREGLLLLRRPSVRRSHRAVHGGLLQFGRQPAGERGRSRAGPPVRRHQRAGAANGRIWRHIHRRSRFSPGTTVRWAS